ACPKCRKFAGNFVKNAESFFMEKAHSLLLLIINVLVIIKFLFLYILILQGLQNTAANFSIYTQLIFKVFLS
ncbi:MAG: hypothetical protein J1E35_07035, partial [Lachnospiraceae bacterium]|nr:hypothetical protein [Lachnospiraceae bacterium]